MCGVVAQLNFRSQKPADSEALLRAREALIHRGPDGAGLHVDRHAGLAHRRLSIIDLDGGAQPMRYEATGCVISFNGEIYNHERLREVLAARGHAFATRSDTEVILAAYAEYGDELVHALEGEYAFVIWDPSQSRLIAVRDRLGVKPLVYAETADGVWLGSEEKALRAAGIGATLNREAACDWLLAGMVLPPRTLFREIQMLPSGSILRCERGALTVATYWDVPYVDRADESRDDLVQRIGARVSSAVKDRLLADVEVAACLSGGLDSTTISAHAVAHRGGQLRTFAARYEENSAVFANDPDAIRDGIRGDDAVFADQAARELGTNHHTVTLDIGDLTEALDQVIWHRDRPLVVMAEFGHYRLYKEVRKHVKVLLSGQGSDELFFGYYYWLARRSRENTTFFPWVWRGQQRAESMSKAGTTHDLLEWLLGGEPAASRERLDGEFRARLRVPATNEYPNKLGYLLLKHHLTELMDVEDRMGMAHSLEVRVPLVDPKVVELVAGAPPAWKLGDRGEKPLLRDGAGMLAPQFVRDRIKSPFPSPLDGEAFYRVAKETLGGQALTIHSLFPRERLQAFAATVSHQASGAIRYAAFRLYTLERWCQLHGVSA